MGYTLFLNKEEKTSGEKLTGRVDEGGGGEAKDDRADSLAGFSEYGTS